MKDRNGLRQSGHEGFLVVSIRLMKRMGGCHPEIRLREWGTSKWKQLETKWLFCFHCLFPQSERLAQRSAVEVGALQSRFAEHEPLRAVTLSELLWVSNVPLRGIM